MTLKYISAAFVLGLLAAGAGQFYGANQHAAARNIAALVPAAGDNPEHGFAGAYLSSHFAQKQNDWSQAATLLDRILKADPKNKELIRQSMVLAAGSGDFSLSAQRARALLTIDPQDALASMIAASQAMNEKNYDESIRLLGAIPKGDMNDFVVPLLLGWAQAGKGEFKPEIMVGSTIHAYHGGLIAHYLKQKPEQISAFAETILSPSGLTAEEVERAADLMAVAGRTKDAINVYKALQTQKGGSEQLSKKLAAVEKNEDLKSLIPALGVTSPSDGAARALLDLARVLYQEDSDQSARVFAQIALGLSPDLVDARMLIASSHARSGRVDEAIAQYNLVPRDHGAYLSAQHAAAELLADNNRMDDAIAKLTAAYESHHNPNSMIRLGDLYRGKENFSKALEIYNQVAATLSDPVPKEYWYLLYARGMALERLGDWKKAEADLTTALKYQPEHPYIMNYLAYGWADQGVRLDESLKMLEEASSLRPEDGFITDSLGWVHYRIGQYAEAIPYLEQAVELLPYDPTINDHLGDAYWRVGRKIEARFQWERAKSYANGDQAVLKSVSEKLVSGLTDATPTKEAKTQPANAAETRN